MCSAHASTHTVRLIADRHCQFLAAFQQFERMNVDEEVQEGVGLNVRPFRSPLGRKAADVPNPQRRSYQVGLYARTYGVRGGVASRLMCFRFRLTLKIPRKHDSYAEPVSMLGSGPIGDAVLLLTASAHRHTEKKRS